MILRTTGIQIRLHFRWPVGEGASLTPEIVDRLAPYVTRYAQTLGVLVHAVGGVEDHLHVVLDIPPTRSFGEINDELRRTTARFVRDVLGQRAFAWAEDGQFLASLSPSDLAAIAPYVREQAARHAGGDLNPYWEGKDGEAEEDEEDDTLPGWLKDVLPKE